MGIIGSIVGGITGSNAAKNASAAEQAADAKAQALSLSNQQDAVGAQKTATTQETANAQPYTAAGSQAVGQLSSLLGNGYGQQFQAPTAAQAEATPGYQFQLQQGQQALQNSAAAKGGLLSGGTAKALDQYSQGLASTNYQNTYNNSLQAYQQNYNQYQNQVAGLQNLTNTGAGSTANLNSLVQAGAQNQGNLDYGFSGQQGADITNAGAAKASGYIGSANAWGNAINNISNQVGGAFPDATGLASLLV